MGKSETDPTREDVRRIARNMLSFNPLAVVITGGDPLVSPHIEEAMALLYGHTGLIVDTSGYPLNDQHVDLFRRYEIAVRISLDSERPRYNDRQRPAKASSKRGGVDSTLHLALSAICRCLDAGVAVSVQSVATKDTANDLPALGDKLFRIGVHSWRVFKVMPAQGNLEVYKKLVGRPGLYPHIFGVLRSCHRNGWKRGMALQLTVDHPPNAVVLVSPDGVYHTESNLTPAKVVLDQKNPRKPRMRNLARKVNMQAHAERYLNLTSGTIAQQS